MNSLKGKILAITRSSKDAGEFLRLVNAKGGKGIALATIEVMPKSGAVTQFLEMLQTKRHEYCAFMSVQAVEALFNKAEIKEIRGKLANTSIIAVGPKTRDRLEDFGLEVDLMPTEYSSKGLAEMFSGMKPSGKKIIIPRSAAAGNYAASSLRSLGMEVDEISLYAVRTSKVSEEWKKFSGLLHNGKISAIIFTSASNVTSFFQIFDSLGEKVELDEATKVVSIGPFTTEALKKIGVGCHESKIHTVRGAVEQAAAVLAK